MKKVNLIDANNLFLANYFKLERLDKGGTYGFIKSISSQDFPVCDLNIAVWDGSLSERRLKICPEYKANRPVRSPEEYEEIQNQKEILNDMLALTNVVTIHIPDVEADDIIASFVMSTYSRIQNCIISSDSDFYQLLYNDSVSIWDHIKKKFVKKEDLPVPPEHYSLYKSLIGDSSDNIKGVKGVGKVRAKKIINSDPVLYDKYVKGHEDIVDRNMKMIDFATIPQNLTNKIMKFIHLEVKKKLSLGDSLGRFHEFARKCRFFGMNSLVNHVNYRFFKGGEQK